MATITYTQDDFKNSSEVDIGDLQIEINNAGFTSANILYINLSKDSGNFTVDIVFDSTLSGADNIALDNIITNYTYTVYENSCFVKDIKSVGTNGGNFTADAWQTRTINTVVGMVNFLTLSSNQFVLKPGSYTILAKAPACDVRNHQTRLYNVTDNTYIMGSNAFSNGGIMTSSEIYTIFSISSEKTYELQHICSTTSANIGFGKATGFNSEEIYTTIAIQKTQ